MNLKLKKFDMKSIKDDKVIEEYEKYSDGLIEKLPLQLDKDFKTCHSVTHFNINHYLDTYFTICTESHCTDREESGNALAFTEKTLKPIMNFHPFILVANAGSLKHLKEYGFKTFSPFIDESYDDIVETNKRLVKVMNEVERVCKIPESALKDIYKDLLSKVVHNQNKIFEYDTITDWYNLLESITDAEMI